MYQFIDRIHTLYGLLQDEKSKEIFMAKLALDIEFSVPNLKRLVSSGNFKLKWNHSLKDILRKLNREHKKIILYGTAVTGKLFAEILELEHIDFYGFCGRNAERFTNGLMEKPVLSPDELVAHGNEYYIVITVNDEKPYTEISQFLQNCNYPEDHILSDWVNLDLLMSGFEMAVDCDKRQYFEFSELYRRGTAFIDGGCYNCDTSRKFAEWCDGAYSSIIAFEPDPDNYALCCEKLQDRSLPNLQLVNAGLSSQEGTATFNAMNGSSSRIISDEDDSNSAEICPSKISIRTVAIDDIIGDCTVGFIKLDIEGAELDALRGAKNTIVRDKPLLAICAYHLRGDVVAIMDYLHQLLPEYRFYLRHYTSWTWETVLYASVDL